MKRLQKTFVILWLLAIALTPRPVLAEQAQVLLVSPQGPYTSIQEALLAAQTGDTIVVRSGTYTGPLVVDIPVMLYGENDPIIDGGGKGTVVTLAAPGIQFRGFTVRNSGTEPDRDHAGIIVRAPDILVEDNTLRDVLFGIFVSEADRVVLRGNNISSKSEYDIARKGDAIRIWYSLDVHVEGNTVWEARDVVAWYSDGIVFQNNRFETSRYGIHLMYCNNARIIKNNIYGNSVGIYTMYSRNVDLLENDIRHQRGPSGYALGFKDADSIRAEGNLLIDNRAGVFLDGTPYSPGSFARFENNVFAFNDIGVVLLSVVRGGEFRGNTFWENVQQMALQGSGKAGENTWEGNYWSDYTGFDVDQDGIGEIPYRSERFFESLTDREPLLRVLYYSPAEQAIEFAASSFPVYKPLPKLEDSAPATVPSSLPLTAQGAPNPEGVRATAALGALLLAVGISIAGVSLKGESWMAALWNYNHIDQIMPGGVDPSPIVSVKQLVKRYGKLLVLQKIDLCVQAGEAVAFWGANGAGKTTLLKAMLGLIDFEGSISISGLDVQTQGKKARARIGYVPQEAIFYDMSVKATLRFYAKLKRVSSRRIPVLVQKLGLTSHLHKNVPALSGGLKQRLALAVALLSEPPILLLDEPTANLDARSRQEYLALLISLRNEGKTIIFASHRIEEVESLADRIILLDAGIVIEELRPGDVRLRLTPEVALTLWVPENERQSALDALAASGWQGHLNGRGTVVVEINAGEKVRALQQLADLGITVHDFEVEGIGPQWN